MPTHRSTLVYLVVHARNLKTCLQRDRDILFDLTAPQWPEFSAESVSMWVDIHSVYNQDNC